MSRLPDDQTASDAEVEAAITALTTAQLIDLKRYAVRKIVGLVVRRSAETGKIF